MSFSSQVTAEQQASASSCTLLLCSQYLLAERISLNTSAFLAAPFSLGVSVQTDPTAQLVSSYLQVINEIIYCLLQ